MNLPCILLTRDVVGAAAVPGTYTAHGLKKLFHHEICGHSNIN